MESTSHDIVKRTQHCLDRIRKRASNEPAIVILLLGRTGVGKSSLLEDLTGAEGHARDASDPVTTVFQLEEAIINGQQYLLMDTPGFDAGDEVETFREIARGIEAIRHYATIVGVLYVTKINNYRVENLDRKLLVFLDSFCGDEYIPQITFVTTHWTPLQGSEVVQHNKLVQLRSLWASFLAKGAEVYQHGQRYNDQDEDTGTCLSWYSDRSKIAEHARNMVSRHYGGADPRAPKILRELDGNIPLHLTSAAKCFGLLPESTFTTSNEPTKEHSRQNTTQDQPSRPPEPCQTGQTTNPSSSPGTGQNNSPHPPEPPQTDETATPSSSPGTGQNNSPHPPEPPQTDETANPSSSPGTDQTDSGRYWSDMALEALEALSGFFQNKQFNVSFGGDGLSFSSGGYPRARVPTRTAGPSLGGTAWDLNSVNDHLKQRGLPHDLGFRKTIGAQRGIFNVGTAEGNEDLLRSLRNQPL